MTLFRPAVPYSDSTKRPNCSDCGAQMSLSQIEPDVPDYDKRTFDCPQCLSSISISMKYK